MQNPFRHRPQDDFGRRDDYGDDQGWQARERRFDEHRSWSEGDGGRTAEAWRDQGRSHGQYSGDDRAFSGSRGRGYGQDQQSRYGGGMSTGWTGDRPQPGGSFDQYGYGAQASQGSRAYAEPTYGQSNYRQSSYDSSERDFGRGRGYSDHGYAPGAQIWEGSGSRSDYYGVQGGGRSDFEPDYLHWRQQQLEAFDKDYSSWRDERRQKFSSDFDSWRQNRAANPIVGDVSDGGTGDASELKKR